jgi:hypothetical protein
MGNDVCEFVGGGRYEKAVVGLSGLEEVAFDPRVRGHLRAALARPRPVGDVVAQIEFDPLAVEVSDALIRRVPFP